MASAVINLTSGAIEKISTGKSTENDDLKPVLQVSYIDSDHTHKILQQWYMVGLSDGSFFQRGLIAKEFFISNKLQKGSILQLTKLLFNKPFDNMGIIFCDRGFLGLDLTVICSKCDIIGDPKRYPLHVPDEDNANSQHVEEPPTSKQNDSLLNEDIDDVKEPPNSIQNPLTSTQKCSSHSSTQIKKRKLESSDDAISLFEKNISDVMKMTLEKTIEDGLGPCYKKLATLEEDVSNMKKMMMEKNKEDVVGFNKLDILEKDVSKMTKMMMEKNKEDEVGACFEKLEILEEDISKLTRMVMEKNKEVVVGFNKLETLEEDISKMKKITTEKIQDNDVGACFEKLKILEEDVSKLTRMMMEKNKEDDMGACIEKLDELGWGAEDPLYDTALLLFGLSADYRKLWLHLKPESCGKWVKNAGSMFGLLD